jgi:hypothetical protein
MHHAKLTINPIIHSASICVHLLLFHAVKGTPFDPSGTSTLTPELVADAFWELADKRDWGVWQKQVSGGS